MTVKREDLTEDNAAHLAALTSNLAEALPDGAGMVMFLIFDTGDQYITSVSATLQPDQFAPVVRRWLERYDNGEANWVHGAIIATPMQ